MAWQSPACEQFWPSSNRRARTEGTHVLRAPHGACQPRRRGDVGAVHFYGMQSLLLYYLYFTVTKGGLGLDHAAASSIVGAYGGLVYLSAIIGSWVADRLVGAERALTGGAILIMCGHLSLALIPGFAGVGIGLVCVSLGSGTLKATTSSVLGDKYELNDPRRDAGFSIYYMAVNIGALVGPLLTGLLWDWKNFHWGFGLAAVGMAIGL